MARGIKFNASGNEADSVHKGNIALLANNHGNGPTSQTGFYSGIVPPVGGYTIYGPGSNIRVAANDSELLYLIDKLGGDGRSVENALRWAATRNDMFITNKEIETIPTDDLELYLDAGHVGSNPGGPIWYDLANNIEFGMRGTLPTVDEAGVRCFNFNGSGYFQSNEGHEQVNMAGDTTLLMWVKSENLTERDTIFEKRGTVYSSYRHEIAVTWESSENFSYYSRNNNYDHASAHGFGIGNWALIGIRMTTGEVEGLARRGFRSINGSAWQEAYTARSTEAIIPAGPVAIGNGYAGTVENGFLGKVMVYDRLITDEEISQIFEAQRGYYGI